MVSAKLQSAFNANRIIVKKLVSGEILLKFHSSAGVPDLVISNDKSVDLLSRKGITVEKLKRSNLADLVTAQLVEILS